MLDVQLPGAPRGSPSTGPPVSFDRARHLQSVSLVLDPGVRVHVRRFGELLGDVAADDCEAS